MYKYNKIENMMLNIVEYGAQQIWKDIEILSNPFERIQERNIFIEACKRLENVK